MVMPKLQSEHLKITVSDNDTLTRVPNTLVGHWADADQSTGTTVILFPQGARGGAVILGAASSTRQLGVFDPTSLPRDIHAVCFSGGSAFGLAAADGVIAFLAYRGIGFDSGYGRVPIVPTAVLFDLATAKTRPDAQSGRAAAEKAGSDRVLEGRVGAGAGATVAKCTGQRLAGGLGSRAADWGDWTLGTLVVVNAFGSVKDAESGIWIAGGIVPERDYPVLGSDWVSNTTLVAIATDAPLHRGQAATLARMASAGIARTLYPAFTPFDGDVVFACSTTRGPPIQQDSLAQLGNLAARLVAQSIVRAVHL